MVAATIVGGNLTVRGVNNVDDTLIKILTDLTLTTNLQVCLDAGDATSFTSGQSWLDRSGNGYDFFLGTTSGAEATDPTFNGTAGLSSTDQRNGNFSSDGGDYFMYDLGVNEVWMDNLHKANTKFSCVALVNLLNTATGTVFFSTTANATNVGMLFETVGSTAPIGRPQIVIKNDAGNALNFGANGVIIPDSTWGMVSCSVDAVTPSNFVGWNDKFFVNTAALASPSVAAAPNIMSICSGGAGAERIFTNGSKIAAIAIWNTNLSQTNMIDIYSRLRSRFGF